MHALFARRAPFGVDRGLLASAALALAGFALCVHAFWPGLLSIDSAVQYIQAMHKDYGDQHPPVMAWLWGWTDRAVKGPGSLLILHLALLWGGLFAIAEGARRRGTPHAWAVLLVGFLPTTLSIAGVIWKDVGMACVLVCAAGFLFIAEIVERRARIVLGVAALVLLVYATMVRSNALFATVPILWLWLVVMFTRLPPRRAPALAVAMVVAILGFQFALDRFAFEARREHLSQMIMLFDLTAIACAGGSTPIPPEYRSPAYDAGTMCEWYEPNQVDKLFFVPGSPLRTSSDDHAYENLRRDWLDAIAADPVRYLRHHNRAFAGLLGIRKANRLDLLIRQPGMQYNPWGFEFERNAASQTIDAITDAAAALGVFKGIVWLALAIFLLVRNRPLATAPRLEVALLASAVLYFLPYYFLSLAPNWRFIYWSALATAIAAVLAAIRSDTLVRLVSRFRHHVALSG